MLTKTRVSNIIWSVGAFGYDHEIFLLFCLQGEYTTVAYGTNLLYFAYWLARRVALVLFSATSCTGVTLLCGEDSLYKHVDERSSIEYEKR